MTITLTREEAQQVLDALADAAWCVQHNNLPPDDGHDWDKELELLRARLAQPEPEPVWVEVTTNTGDKFILDSAVEADKIRAAKNVGLSVVPLYIAPPQREWQGLTDEEIDKALWENESNYLPDIIRIAEAKLKEKNG